MIRDVDFIEYYLPPFMQKYKEPVATLKAEEPEFQIVWKAVDRIMYNRFISTADEYGISRFEKMLGIYPTSDDTLESRRSRVQSKWFTTIPYTLKVLLQKLTVLCGDTDFTMVNNFTEGYTITLDTDLELFGQVEELENIINTMLPENIVIISNNNIPCIARGVALFGGGLAFSNMFIITNDFREIFEVSSGFAFGGGLVKTDFLQLSDAFNENQSASGTFKFGGGISETAMVTISQDFNKIIRSDAEANVGSGIVQVDFIEIQ